jgi:hypothetical protein
VALLIHTVPKNISHEISGKIQHKTSTPPVKSYEMTAVLSNVKPKQSKNPAADYLMWETASRVYSTESNDKYRYQSDWYQQDRPQRNTQVTKYDYAHITLKRWEPAS